MGNDGFANMNNIYAYTYAAPNYTNIEEKIDSVVDVPGIFNIINKDDIVPTVPYAMYYYLVYRIPLYKAGKSNNLSIYTNKSGFETVIKDLYSEIPFDTYTTYKAHMPATYLALIKANTQCNEVGLLSKFFRFLKVECPVDVAVYDQNNELCALTSGSEVIYPKESAVIIRVIDDKKYIDLPDENYTIKYIGTDEGTMKIQDQIISVESGEISSEKVFDNVSIEKGKEFESSINPNGTTTTNLNVIDEDGDTIATVATNGKETLLAKYNIKDKSIIFDDSTFEYDGKEKKLSATVDSSLKEGVDYRIIYNNNIDIGIASVTIKGINDYSGTVTKQYSITKSGTINDKISWQIDKNQILRVTGTGILPDSENENNLWGGCNKQIISAFINNGITSIGNNAFYGCENLSSISIPNSVKSIGIGAFEKCSENFKIFCYSDSYAEQYAALNNINYEIIGSEQKEPEYRINSITIRDSNGTICTSVPQSELLLTISITNINSFGNTKVMLAEYTEERKFVGILWISIEDLHKDATIKVTVPVDNSSKKISKFKAFIINSFSNMQPLGNCIVFPTEQ